MAHFKCRIKKKYEISQFEHWRNVQGKDVTSKERNAICLRELKQKGVLCCHKNFPLHFDYKMMFKDNFKYLCKETDCPLHSDSLSMKLPLSSSSQSSDWFEWSSHSASVSINLAMPLSAIFRQKIPFYMLHYVMPENNCRTCRKLSACLRHVRW